MTLLADRNVRLMLVDNDCVEFLFTLESFQMILNKPCMIESVSADSMWFNVTLTFVLLL
jgi:hypothetical protein